MGWPCFLYLLEEPSGATYVGCTRRPLERARRAERKGWTLRAIIGPIEAWSDALRCRDEWRACPAAPLTARDVQDALAARDLATTTVLTVLGRLERKGLVTREREGRAHRYRSVASREDHVAELMRDALDAAPDRGAVLARFLGSIPADERAALRDLLD